MTDDILCKIGTAAIGAIIGASACYSFLNMRLKRQIEGELYDTDNYPKTYSKSKAKCKELGIPYTIGKTEFGKNQDYILENLALLPDGTLVYSFPSNFVGRPVKCVENVISLQDLYGFKTSSCTYCNTRNDKTKHDYHIEKIKNLYNGFLYH